MVMDNIKRDMGILSNASHGFRECSCFRVVVPTSSDFTVKSDRKLNFRETYETRDASAVAEAASGPGARPIALKGTR